MRLLKTHRKAILDRIIEQAGAPRRTAFRNRENAIAIRMLRHRYGDDVFERCRALPEGWLRVKKTLELDHFVLNALPRYRVDGGRFAYILPRSSIELSEYAPLPDSAPSGWTREVLGHLYDDVYQFYDDQYRFHEEMTLLSNQIIATLAAYTTVENLAAGWPEGYEHLPQRLLAETGNLPAPRIEDLNARIAAIREAA